MICTHIIGLWKAKSRQKSSPVAWPAIDFARALGDDIGPRRIQDWCTHSSRCHNSHERSAIAAGHGPHHSYCPKPGPLSAGGASAG